MDPEILEEWALVLERMVADEGLEAAVVAENPWFTYPMVRQQIHAIRSWFAAGQLAGFQQRYPQVRSPRRIGLILAGNLPLVGFHDVLMVLLSGHHAVVKPSHKDSVLLRHLYAHAPLLVRSRMHLVSQIDREYVDFLIATGSNATARQIGEQFAGLPHLLRQNRFSVAVLEGNESGETWRALAGDIVLYHGMGCRSVSCLLVPEQMGLQPLLDAIELFHPDWFAAHWQDILRYARAVDTVLDHALPQCKYFVLRKTLDVQPAQVGCINVLRYQDSAEVGALLSGLENDLQCVVAANQVPFGQAQYPRLDDFADGIDTMAILTNFE
jgi:hypothetical protein